MSAVESKRTVPSNADIEADVLGTTMIDPSLLELIDAKVKPSDFYWSQHQIIWRVIVELLRAGRQPIEATVRDEIIARGWQDKIVGRDASGTLLGDCGYLAHLTGIAFPPSYESSVTKLLELSRCRHGIDICWRIIADLQTGGVESQKILENGLKDLGAILESGSTHQNPTRLAQFAQDEAKRVIEYSHKGQGVRGATTGWKWLNESMLGGFQPADFITIGARPGTGKTKVSLAMLSSACLEGTRCGMISLDMGPSRLMPYVIPAFHNLRETDRITAHEIYDPGQGGEFGEAKLLSVCDRLDPDSNCYLITNPRTTDVSSISGYVRKLVKLGCRIILLDQVQNIGGWSRGSSDRGSFHEIYDSLRKIPLMYDVTFIVLHQIQREGSDRPELKHLKDTGCVEEFSDFVILLHDYQSALISTHGGFALQGEKARAPKANELNTMITKAIPERIISVHLAKTRSSATERKDCWFNYSLGIQLRRS